MTYNIIRAYSCEDLIEAVNEQRQWGWKPSGGLVVYYEERTDKTIWAQAMVSTIAPE